MRIFKLLIVSLGALLLLYGCAGNNSNPNTAVDKVAAVNTKPTAPEQRPADEFGPIRKVYKEHCAGCHKDNGEGGEVNFDGATLKVPSFKRPSIMSDPDSELIEQIENGSDEMPSFKSKLNPEQIKDLVRFIRKELQAK